MIEITQQHAEKVIDLLSHGLVSGLGQQAPGIQWLRLAPLAVTK